jgi:hypothetical protein
MAKSARQIVRECAEQDFANAGEEGFGGWGVTADGDVRWDRPARAVVRGWRDQAAQAGDDAVVGAIDSLGEIEAATEYVAKAESIAADKAMRS